MIVVVGVFRKSILVFLLCMISVNVLNACAGKGTLYYGAHSTADLPSGAPRVAVMPFEDWNPPDEGFGTYLRLVPGILYTGHNTYMSHKYAATSDLAAELSKSGAFSAVDSLGEWPPAETLLSRYDFVVTGRLLGYGFNSRDYLYGVGPMGMFPMFLGLPMYGTMNFGNVEVVVFRVRTPYEPILKEKVTYESSRAWSGLYYHNHPASNEIAREWRVASDHIVNAISSSSQIAK